MCGIFGVISFIDYKGSTKIFRNLFLWSESRGKEASGFALIKPEGVKVYKTPFSATTIVRNRVFKEEVLEHHRGSSEHFIGIGHSRLVTNGYEQYEHNNQPVIKHGMVVVHNGIIVNNESLWKKLGTDHKVSDLDSELIPEIIYNRTKSGENINIAFKELFTEVCGMTNIAWLSEKYNNLILATNNGSLYYLINKDNCFFAFASERHILEKVLAKENKKIAYQPISHLVPGEMISINFRMFTIHRVRIGQEINNLDILSSKTEIKILKNNLNERDLYINTSLEHKDFKIEPRFEREFASRSIQIGHLKRCTKCILPESFPLIEFDENGVCNYCNGYQHIAYRGSEQLLKIAEKYRKADNHPDCLIPFSGGRDSSYTLHYVVKELGLKPVAFSYDWGMLTDLARRNQSRICGKLGIEHILVSADIRQKRENIRKNVMAWLKKPELGTIPLFMAGDKQYFYYTKHLRKQLGVDLVVMGENQLEKTLFKTAFTGAKQDVKGYMAYHISGKDKFRLLNYYLGQFILNPAYINSSILDTAGSFLSYYTIKHNYLNLFDFIRWDEKSIIGLLKNEYEWETDPETTSTWRIGDGTASFYNYIYFMVAGFTENDTFRSNQIREGVLTRDEGLAMANEDNRVRFNSLKWYCDTIHIDFANAIDTINKIKTIYGIR